MFVLIILATVFSISNQEFIKTATKQMKEGHTWQFVGKQKPTGVPAITLRTFKNEKYIIFKLNQE